MNADDDFEEMRRVLLEFALACRAERDRLAAARLDNDDRRIDEETADALMAKHLADRLIDGCR